LLIRIARRNVADDYFVLAEGIATVTVDRVSVVTLLGTFDGSITADGGN
jgi:hypothetical protein